MATKQFKAPEHLRPATRKWWQSVASEYVLEPHHIHLLTLASESWDCGQAAREAIQKHGMVFTDRFGTPKSRPEVAIARDSRIAFARLVRELGLDVSPPAEIRPSRIGGAKY